MSRRVNASELPDDTEVYVAGFGVTTAGELRSPLEAIDAEGDTALRRWIFFTLYQPTKQPWPSGPISVGGKEYPQSVFTSDRFLPLYTSSGTTAGVDTSNPCELREHAKRSLKEIRRFDWLSK